MTILRFLMWMSLSVAILVGLYFLLAPYGSWSAPIVAVVVVAIALTYATIRLGKARAPSVSERHRRLFSLVGWGLVVAALIGLLNTPHYSEGRVGATLWFAGFGLLLLVGAGLCLTSRVLAGISHARKER